jgi:uncharacterized protein (DUF4213/DUF364 family)
MILEKTIDLIKQIYKIHKIIPPKITKVVIGLGYTGVEVTAYGHEPFLGLASTLSSIVNKSDCSKIEFAGSITNFHLSEVLNWAIAPPSIKKIIGIATLNGVSQHILRILNPYKKLEGNLLDFLEIDENTSITFIGLIKPLIREVRKKTQSITLTEDTIPIPPEFESYKNKRDINQIEIKDLSIDILFCTGTALINDTIERILEIFKNKARKIIMIGPSVSIIPDILFDYGVDIVGGMEIYDSIATIKILQEGGGTKFFKNYGKKYNLIKD